MSHAALFIDQQACNNSRNTKIQKDITSKKTHEFQKREKNIFIINMHSAPWIMQGTQQIGNWKLKPKFYHL